MGGPTATIRRASMAIAVAVAWAWAAPAGAQPSADDADPGAGDATDAAAADQPVAGAKKPAQSARLAGRQSELASVAEYFAELENMGLVDVETGSKETLAAELAAAQAMLTSGASIRAAIALYAIVESPRYDAFKDFVEYQSAEYYLGVALAAAGAYDTAIEFLLRVVARGSAAAYYPPAHRRIVDIAIETRDYRGALDALARVGKQSGEPPPPEASGEQRYLRGRMAYVAGDTGRAESELAQLSRKSRLYSSALYLRGVIRARNADFGGAAEALCEVAEAADDDDYSFIIDDRYYTIKDLARLGLGRIAHEQGDYDDAYYHYFQIPDDSERLPEALFEAAWSMYQKGDLEASRDLVREFISTFPTSPLRPEASLLAGYVELADCQFTGANQHYDGLIAELEPVVAELDRIRREPASRDVLFARAVDLWRAERIHRGKRARAPEGAVADRIVGLLRLDPEFIRLSEAVQGLRSSAGEAPHVVRAWTGLGRRASRPKVARIAEEASLEQEDAADANALYEDVRRLSDELARARAELRRGVREETLPKDAADAEAKRLGALARDIDALEAKTAAAARQGDAAIGSAGSGQESLLATMIARDLELARELDAASRELLERMSERANQLAQRSIDRLYTETRRVLDKAKLGKVDAVIGQKRRLDIEVQDLANGRFPAELRGRLWEQGLIGDDEEYWPWEGEYWEDEYEGWR